MCAVDGNGFLILNDGSLYAGAFKQGRKHGKVRGRLLVGVGEEADGDHVLIAGPGACVCVWQGRIEYANGDVFEGTFANDMIAGVGVLKCANGSTYTGQWAQSQVRLI